MKFRELYKTMVPSWLSSGEGEFVLYSLGIMLDAGLERLRLGTLARFPSQAPSDALGYLGRDRKIVRGINEPDAAYAARLIRWLDDHAIRGNPFALHDQIRAYCQADVMVRTVDRRGNWYTTAANGTRSVALKAGNWDWDGGAATQWARFWVIIYPTAAGDPWSDITTWGGWAETGTHEPDQVNTIRAIIQDWKPAGTRCEWVIVAYDAASFPGSSTPNPGGDWRWFGLETGGAYDVVRTDTARYWRGVDGT